MTIDIREKIARQLDLENESRTLGAERYRSQGEQDIGVARHRDVVLFRNPEFVHLGLGPCVPKDRLFVSARPHPPLSRTAHARAQ